MRGSIVLIKEKQEEDKYLTFKEICDEFSISQATLKNWIKLEKIFPNKINENNEYLFTQSNIDELKKAILDGTNSALKSRRNKTYVSGNSMYNSYISEFSENVSKIQSLLENLKDANINLSDEIIMLFVAECAIQLYLQRRNSEFLGSNPLHKFLTGELKLDEFTPFVEDFIVDKHAGLEFVDKHQNLFSINYKYEFGEDILGLLYISMKNIGNRKATGAYYTPTKIVKRLINNLFKDESCVYDKKLFDPCCGTGNFLLQLPEIFTLDNIYANDIDIISCKITKINLALHFENYDYNFLADHVTNKDFLHSGSEYKFDYIIGNPPWGYKFSDDEQKYLKSNFETAQNKNIESFDVVIEQALKNLQIGGILSFVLPESILNVKSHTKIRNILSSLSEIQYLEYLGNAFDNVHCPSIILQIMYTNQKMSALGLKVKDNKREFVLQEKREISDESFSFRTDDEEYKLVKKLLNTKNHTTLFGNSIFALGIVTGNNTDYIEKKKREDNEIVLKGSNVYKYGIKPTDNYISYKPENFQQVAPTEYYRADEKLLYRFISNKLIFAYDNSQILSLNSCNILIPNIKDMNIKYIMAVLNSKVSQFIYSKHFNSIKILRSHLEQLPIPIVDFGVQKKVIELVDKLILETSSKVRDDLYLQIEDIMYEIFDLNSREREIIIKEIDASNNFLY